MVHASLFIIYFTTIPRHKCLKKSHKKLSYWLLLSIDWLLPFANNWQMEVISWWILAINETIIALFSLCRWNLIKLSILITSPIHFLLGHLGELTFNTKPELKSMTHLLKADIDDPLLNYYIQFTKDYHPEDGKMSTDEFKQCKWQIPPAIYLTQILPSPQTWSSDAKPTMFYCCAIHTDVVARLPFRRRHTAWGTLPRLCWALDPLNTKTTTSRKK